uniref:Uncharacterized protein n=2 Tax=Aegilops tauschii subsp. strangulata TaxID=200361 RepID=A0A453NTK4_AEGTS
MKQRIFNIAKQLLRRRRGSICAGRRSSGWRARIAVGRSSKRPSSSSPSVFWPSSPLPWPRPPGTGTGAPSTRESGASPASGPRRAHRRRCRRRASFWRPDPCPHGLRRSRCPCRLRCSARRGPWGCPARRPLRLSHCHVEGEQALGGADDDRPHWCAEE